LSAEGPARVQEGVRGDCRGDGSREYPSKQKVGKLIRERRLRDFHGRQKGKKKRISIIEKKDQRTAWGRRA